MPSVTDDQKDSKDAIQIAKMNAESVRMTRIGILIDLNGDEEVKQYLISLIPMVTDVEEYKREYVNATENKVLEALKASPNMWSTVRTIVTVQSFLKILVATVILCLASVVFNIFSVGIMLIICAAIFALSMVLNERRLISRQGKYQLNLARARSFDKLIRDIFRERVEYWEFTHNHDKREG